jgi:hypothetical protein
MSADGSPIQHTPESAVPGVGSQLRFIRSASGTGYNWDATALPQNIQHRIQRIDSAAYAVSSIVRLLQANDLADSTGADEVLDANIRGGLFVAAEEMAKNIMVTLEELRDAYPEQPR